MKKSLLIFEEYKKAEILIILIDYPIPILKRILFIHAEDQLMTTVCLRDIALEFKIIKELKDSIKA